MHAPIPESLIRGIESAWKINLKNPEILGGGDIHNVVRFESGKGIYSVLKYHSFDMEEAMLEKEKNGLLEISSSHAIKSPEIIGYGTHKRVEYLLLEYIPLSKPDAEFWKLFGQQLALMHRHTQNNFGFSEDNYIGSLPQLNNTADSWPRFYSEERILPQIRMAEQASLFRKQELNALYALADSLKKFLDQNVTPSLIHGDLWQGNFICSSRGPVLIDPAVCYADREMDLAMSLLFGGFAQLFYDAYHESWPLEPGWEERIKLYQLYYLLVHVNLFGRSYVPGVMRITERFI